MKDGNVIINDALDPPVYLYIKKHRITGLKYFGRTVQDPFKYRGSGVYWNKHLTKHGDDVETEIYGKFESRKLLVESAVSFSLDNNIVSSSSWANMVIETGERSVLPGTSLWDRKFTFTDEDVKDLVDKGLTAQELAAHFGCSVSLINSKMRKAKLKIKTRPKFGGTKIIIDFDAMIEEYIKTSASQEELALKFGVSSSTIRNILKDRGISRGSKYSIEDPDLVIRLYLEGDNTVSLGKNLMYLEVLSQN